MGEPFYETPFCVIPLDCPMSQHMSRHQNTTKNIQQTTHVMTLNATYDIGQFDIKEFKILKKIFLLKTQCHMLYKCLNNV